MGKVVFSTELSLNAFWPNNNNASQSRPTVQLAVPLHYVYVQDYWYSIVCMYRTTGAALCACTGLLVQHCVYVQDCWYSIVCMYRTAGSAVIDCEYNEQQPYTA